MSRRYPPKYETLNEAFTTQKINPKTKRLAKHYACASCGEDFPAKEVQVDHKVPVVDPTQGFINWDTYIPRLFCEKENLQVLCKGCHDVKTKEEKEMKSATSTKKSKPIKASSISKASSRKKKKTS